MHEAYGLLRCRLSTSGPQFRRQLGCASSTELRPVCCATCRFGDLRCCATGPVVVLGSPRGRIQSTLTYWTGLLHVLSLGRSLRPEGSEWTWPMFGQLPGQTAAAAQ